MTSKAVVVGTPEERTAPWLRAVGLADQDLLRAWRNANRAAFFETAVVDENRQQRWFRGYLGRADDFLFLVMAGDAPVGCVGVRLVDDGWDVYNVIRGVGTAASRGFMGRGLRMAVAFARGRRDLPVTAVVLAANPAVAWYARQGFVIVGRRPESVLMRWAGPFEAAGIP
jgi:ribosomal protein S18 acetylase RimI-like enzyme